MTGGEKPRRVDLAPDTPNRHGVPRPEIDDCIEHASPARVHTDVSMREAAFLRAVDRLAISPKPSPNCLQTGDRGFGNRSIRTRSDIQQVIAAIARALDEVLY